MAAPPSVPAPTSTSSSSAAAAASASASASGSSAAPAAATAVSSSGKWTSEQDRLFEKALATYNQDSPTRWDDVSAMVPGKSPADVKKHYELLAQDIRNIEAGLIALPSYGGRDALLKEQNGSVAVESPVGKKVLPSSSSSLYPGQGHANGGAAGAVSVANGSNTGGSSKSSKSQDQERRKGIPWTEDEHRLFLLGLEKFGKGDWRSISRNFVVSRTPTQVASHAQKYFIRLNSIHKDKRRTSIHDITSVNGDGRQQSQAPITGQGAAAAGAAVGQPASGYGSSVGQPIPAAVGTPVPLSQPVHGPYGPRTHMSRPVVPGTPLNVPHMAYPMPQPAMHH